MTVLMVTVGISLVSGWRMATVLALIQLCILFPCCNSSSDLRHDESESVACLNRELKTSFYWQLYKSVYWRLGSCKISFSLDKSD